MTNTKPKPHYACFICLRKLGYGYDRTANRFLVRRGVVHKWFKYHRVSVERPPRALKPKHVPINYDERWRSFSQRKLAVYFTACLWHFTKHGGYRKRVEPLIGCCRQHFLNHIASQFHSGMSFANYGTVWHLDHRLPQSAFDLRLPRERQQCYYYPNIQPLLAHDNRTKSVKCPLPVFLPANDNRIDPAKLRFPLGTAVL